MLKARSALGVTSFGMQLAPVSAERRSLPRARPRERRPGGGLHRARGSGDPARPAARSTVLEPGVFARVGPSETRKLITGDEPARDPRARRRPRQALRGHAASPRRASPTRSPRTAEPMADVTVKRIEDFEAIFGGGFRRVRAGLGVSSFGLAVMDLPPNFTDYPDHDQAHDHQEEVYTAAQRPGDARVGGQAARSTTLEPGVWIRVGRGREAQDRHRRRARAGARDRRVARARPTGRPSSPRRAPRHRDVGTKHAAEHLTSAARRDLAEQVLVGGALEGRRGPGPSSSVRQRPAPRTSDRRDRRTPCRGPGRRPRRARRRPRSPSPRARARARRRARASRRAATRPAQPIATSAWPSRHGRPKLSAITTRGPRARTPRRSRPRIRRAEASASAGSRATVSSPGTFEESIPALAQIQPPWRLDDQHRRARRGRPGATLARTSSTSARVLAELGGELDGPLAGLDRRQPPRPAPRPSRRPSARRRPRRRRRLDAARLAAAAISSPSVVALADLRQPRERRDLERRAHARCRGDRTAVAAAPRRSPARARAFGERRGERDEVVGGVEVERQRVEPLDRRPRSRRARPGRGGARSCPRRTPARSRRRAPGARRVGAGAVAVGDDADPARVASAPARRRARRGRAAGSRRAAAPRIRRRATSARMIPSVAASEWPRSSGSRSTSIGVSTRRAWRRAIRSARPSPVTTMTRSTARAASTAARTSASIAFDDRRALRAVEASSSRCLAAPKRFTGMIAVALIAGRDQVPRELAANSSTCSARARAARRVAHQGRAATAPRARPVGARVAGVDDHPVEQPGVQRGDAGGAERPAERRARNASVGPLTERPPTSGLTATTGAPEPRRSPRARRAGRGSARSRSPGSTAPITISVGARAAPRAPRRSGAAAAIPSSSTPSTSPSPWSRIRNSCSPRQPARGPDRVRTGSLAHRQHPGARRRATRAIWACAAVSGPALGEEVGAVQRRWRGRGRRGEPARRAELLEPLVDDEGVVPKAPAALARRSRRRASR